MLKMYLFVWGDHEGYAYRVYPYIEYAYTGAFCTHFMVWLIAIGIAKCRSS